MNLIEQRHRRWRPTSPALELVGLRLFLSLSGPRIARDWGTSKGKQDAQGVARDRSKCCASKHPRCIQEQAPRCCANGSHDQPYNRATHDTYPLKAIHFLSSFLRRILCPLGNRVASWPASTPHHTSGCYYQGFHHSSPTAMGTPWSCAIVIPPLHATKQKTVTAGALYDILPGQVAGPEMRVRPSKVQ